MIIFIQILLLIIEVRDNDDSEERTHLDVAPFSVGHEDLQRGDGLRDERAEGVEVRVSVEHHAVRLLRFLRCQRVVYHVAQQL